MALAIVAVLVVVSVGWFVTVKLKTGATDFTVGKCVQRQGNSATVVDCSTSGAFKIVSTANSEQDCQTAGAVAWLSVTENGATTFRCLAPANG